ncbi:MAG: hypothetical protein J7L34_08595 [Thermotogaceae bacterium]|nr:hypothetical protein [Thermotogaceae bacterium]
MKKLITLVIFLLVASPILGSTYKIDASFDSTTLTIDATLNVLLDSPASYVYFNLYPNLHEEKNPYIWDISAFEDSKGWIKIKNVKIRGKDAKYEILRNPADLFQKYSKNHALLKVENPELYKEIEIIFTLRFPRAATADETCWGGACIWRFGWYPIEIYNEKEGKQQGFVYTPHTCSIKMNLPQGYLFATHQGEGIGCPVGIFKGYNRFTLEGKHYTVNVYYKKGRKERAQALAAIELDALERLSKRFGYLDYKVVNVIESPVSGAFGMTTNGFIVLGDGAFTTADLWIPGFLNPLYEFLILHETAHLWFGIGATVDFIYNNFLSESLAQYASITEIERMYGRYINLYDINSPDIFTSTFKEMFAFKSLRENYLYLYRNLWRNGFDTAVQGKSEVVNQDFPKNYAKGYFGMRSLSLYFDDFDQVLRKYHEIFKGNVVTYENFKNFLESQKKGAAEIADEIFKNPGPIDARVYTKGNKIVVEGPDFPYEVLIRSSKSGESLKKVKGKFEIDKNGIYSVEVDPKWLLPDPDRFNNNYPVKILLPDIIDIQNSAFTESSTETEIISPLEAYKLDAPNLSVSYTSDSSYVFLSYNFGIRKFDEWGIWIGGGSAIPASTDVSEYGIYSASGFFSPNDFFQTSANIIFDEKSIIDAEAIVSLSIPEKVDIGLSSPEIISRNNFTLTASYDSSQMSLAGYYTYSDFVKLPVLLQIGGIYYHPEGFVLSSEAELLPAEFFDTSLLGAYSPNSLITANFFTDKISYTMYGNASLGFHLNADLLNRLNIFNMASFRGLVLSLRGGIEGGMTQGNILYYYTTSTGLTFKMFLPLDTLAAAGMGIKSYFDSNFKYKGSFIYIGVDLSDYIISSLKTALSSHVRLQEPRILQLQHEF